MEKNFTINAQKFSIRCKAYFDEWRAPQTVILYGHGFGGHKDNRAAERFARRVLEKNRSVLMLCFDWPCHGDDALKKLSLEVCDSYLEIVLSYVEENWAPERLLGYATSFGAYLFLRFLQTHGNPFARLALRCPAVPMYQVMTNAILEENAREKLRKGRPAQIGFDRKVEVTPDFLEELRAGDISGLDFLDFADDLLILHGTKDEIVPMDAVAAFADENCIEFVPVENADHRFQDPKTVETATAAILRFFALR